jgi:CheY-like chemotaxis protein
MVAERRIILIADDNIDSADSLALLLSREGHEVHTANDGLEAVEAAARLHPDYILLDIEMPRLDGYGAAERIRAQEQDRGAVIVALSGWDADELREREAESGFDLHLRKPIDFPILRKVLAGTFVPESDDPPRRSLGEHPYSGWT